MYVIVTIAGKQYKVSEGDTIRVASLDSKIGESVTFNHVLLTDDGKKIKVGTPLVKNAAVTATIAEHGRARKILVYKKKKRKGYQRKNGHRQDFTTLEIKKIKLTAPKKTTAKKTTAKPKKAAPKKSAGEK